MEQLIVTIKNGNVDIEVEGIKGDRCLELTQAIEQLMGNTEQRSFKNHFYTHGEIRRGIHLTTLATKKVTIYTEILLSCEYCVEQNLFPRAHLRGIFNRHGNHYTANATLLKFWPR